MAEELTPSRFEVERAIFAEWNHHLRATDQKYLSVFLLFVTAGGAIVGLSGDHAAGLTLTLQQWLGLAIFGTVCTSVMGGLRVWKNRYSRVVREIMLSWNVPEKLNPFGPGLGVDPAMIIFVAVVSVSSLMMFCYELGRQ